MEHRLKTKALETLERKMESVETGSLRHQVLQSVKNFKTSWIELGQALYAVWKDKHYKEWGYGSFDAYAAKEIGIRKETALKLLKSYYFLEKEEPHYLERAAAPETSGASVPSYEAINTLRLARNNKNIDERDYSHLKKAVFESGKEAPEVRKELTSIIRQRQELDSDEVREERRRAMVRRLLGSLRALHTEATHARLLPSRLMAEIATVIKHVEEEAGA